MAGNGHLRAWETWVSGLAIFERHPAAVHGPSRRSPLEASTPQDGNDGPENHDRRARAARARTSRSGLGHQEAGRGGGNRLFLLAHADSEVIEERR